MDDDQKSTEGSRLNVRFFESPRQAVDAIRVMLENEDWTSLASYYDLEGSDVDRDTLTSGEFFIRSERPDLAHPGGFWRHRHPFAPSFVYAFTTPAMEAGVVIVRVVIQIDQGSDSPPQDGWQEFSMRESEKRFQILTYHAEPMDVEGLIADPGPPLPGFAQD